MDERLSQLPIPLLDWYRENARQLPWRENVTPYRVWVSEIMLQQTRVAAVLGYFARFIEAFPTVEDLAAAPEDALLKLWQGLGYYSRAKNLQKAARQIVTDFGGVFPTEYRDVLSLAGVGEYTAAALCSIVYGQAIPAVDGNLLRVTARIMADDGDITAPATRKRLTEALREVIPVDFPGRFNQAMMDLGATVCLPNGTPLCEKCPASDFCGAYQTGRTGELPVRAAKKPRRREERTVFLLFSGGRVALRKRPKKGLLAGLWEYPNAPSPAENALEDWGISVKAKGYGGTGVHIFTHVEWHITAVTVETDGESLPEGWVWADAEGLAERYALPSAFAPFAAAVQEGLRYEAEF